MSDREIIAYAISHAPPGVKGGPYESEGAQTVALLKDAWRIGPCFREYARDACGIVQHRVSTARVICVVRKARPSEAEPTLETARGRLAAVAEHMTEHAYQEMASALEVDACRVAPSEASAVEVLRELVAWWEGSDPPSHMGDIIARARRVLAAAGPDPMPVVRAAMDLVKHDHSYRNPTLHRAVDAYRKAGGK